MAEWRQAINTDFYAELKDGKYALVMKLLYGRHITLGKACEAMAEIALGFVPSLSTPTVEKSVREGAPRRCRCGKCTEKAPYSSEYYCELGPGEEVDR